MKYYRAFVLGLVFFFWSGDLSVSRRDLPSDATTRQFFTCRVNIIDYLPKKSAV